MKTKFVTLIIILSIPFLWNRQQIVAQNIAITDDDSYNADSSAMLDVMSLSKGILFPRLTSVQRIAISNPATGLIIYQTDNTQGFYYYNGSAWSILDGSATNELQALSISNDTIYLSNGGFVKLPATGTINPDNTQVCNSATEGNIRYNPATKQMEFCNGTEWMALNATSTFICGTSTISDIEGNVYNTIAIGSQCWLKENLKTTKYADNTPMVDGTGAGDITGNYTTKYYFDYANNPANTVIYGKLYTWAAVMNSAVSTNAVPSNVLGVCPTGWHLPSDAEWNIMEKYLDSTVDTTAATWAGTDIGSKLKEPGTTHWNSPNTDATNSSGFTGLPGGLRPYDGTFNSVGIYGCWWSATENDAFFAWKRDLYFFVATMSRFYNDKVTGLSVRCVKD